jgi:cyclase
VSLARRIIPCLDVKDGRVVKGVRFLDLRDQGDPAAFAAAYEAQGADEIAVLDVAATPAGRDTQLGVVRAVGKAIAVPLMAGGGVRSLADMGRLLEAGADKVAVNTAAVARPALLNEAEKAYGRQFVVLSVDALRQGPGAADWVVTTAGGRTATDRNVLDWIREAVDRGAGEVLLNAIDADGTRQGYACALTAAAASVVGVPVIASGGAGGPEDVLQAFREGKADAVLAASIFHEGLFTVTAIKDYLAAKGIPVRRPSC